MISYGATSSILGTVLARMHRLVTSVSNYLPWAG